MFSPVQQECLTQVSHIYNMPALCLKLILGTGSTQGHQVVSEVRISEYHFSLEAFSYESRYKLAINSQQPTVEFRKLLRNLGKRLPSILSFVFCDFCYCCLFFVVVYSLVISTFKIKPRALVHTDSIDVLLDGTLVHLYTLVIRMLVHGYKRQQHVSGFYVW